MYLFIFEDNSMERYADISKDDMQSADDGYCDIIDFSDADNPRFYSNGEWFDIEVRTSGE